MNADGKLQMANGRIQRPAWRHFGGKWRLAPFVLAHLPAHDHYVEPFAGAASVLLRKERSTHETINDLDGEIVNFFRVLREREIELMRAIGLTPYARAEFVNAFEVSEDPVERARRFYVRAQMSFGGVRSSGHQSAGWKFNRSLESKRSCHAREFADIAHFPAIAARLRGVQIESRDAFDVIRACDAPGTLFYLDPPYHPATRDRRWRKAYSHELDAGRWTDLLGLLGGLQGMALLSCYPHAETANSLEAAGWQCVQKDARTSGAGARVECLWMNANAARVSLEVAA